MGDILAMGLAKKALSIVGATTEHVTETQMKQALKSHIGPALNSFMSPDKSKSVIREMEKMIGSVG
ncbi:MAG: hypothetical protein KAT70_06390 [Thermoplasmata archaeon]|nr:hypothetical protein [Thermoplasmata archaeon]